VSLPFLYFPPIVIAKELEKKGKSRRQAEKGIREKVYNLQVKCHPLMQAK
jgi:hypothetical protein